MSANKKPSGGDQCPPISPHRTQHGFAAIARRHARKVAILAAILVGAGGYYYWQRSASDGAADRPLIATVAYGNVENTVAAAGNLQPSNTVPVGAQVSGQLRKVHVLRRRPSDHGPTARRDRRARAGQQSRSQRSQHRLGRSPTRSASLGARPRALQRGSGGTPHGGDGRRASKSTTRRSTISPVPKRAISRS